MKILKYLLYLIIALIVLFFAFGIFKPTVSYGHEITVNKSAKETWAVSQDASKFHLWLEGFKSIELISGAQNMPGSKYKVIVSPGNGQPDFEIIETFESVKENELIEMSFDNDQMHIDYSVSHKESNGKTTIKTEAITRGSNIFMRSMFAIMDIFGGFQTQETKNIEALKKVIEENTTDYFPQPINDAVEEVNSQVTD